MPIKRKKNKLPDFNKMSYEEEARWWDTHDLGDYTSELKDVDIIFDLHKPKEDTLIIRLQKDLKTKLEYIAKSKGLNVSSLARMWLMERLHSMSR